MIQKVVVLVVLFVSAFSLSAQVNIPQKSESFTLSGKIDGSHDGIIYLIRSDVAGFEVDSTALRNGVFIFKGQIGEPEYAELLLYNCPFSEYEAPIFIEPANMKVTGDIDNFRYLYLSGSAAEEDFRNLVDMKRDSRLRLNNLKTKLETVNLEIAAANGKSDSLQNLAERLSGQEPLIENELSVSDSVFISRFPNSYVTAYLINNNLKIERFTLSNVDSLYAVMPERVKRTSYGKNILRQMRLEKIATVGEIAPLFTGKDQSGNLIRLSDFRDSGYVLLDFWASWCGPCRILSPELRQFYQKYSDKGLKMISIAIDDKETDWRKAISEDKTGAWIQIMDDTSNIIRNLYGANFVPLYYLINKNGIIVGKYGGGESSYGTKSFYFLYRDLETLFTTSKTTPN